MKLFVFILITFNIFSSDLEHLFSLDNLNYLKQSSPPIWMIDQIRKDFQPFSETGFDLSGLDSLHDHLMHDFPHNTFYRFLRFRIINGEIYIFRSPSRRLEHDEDYNFYRYCLLYCKWAKDLPNIDFIIHYNDATPCEGSMPEYFWLKDEERKDLKPAAPLLTYAKSEDRDRTIGLIHVPWCFSLMNHNAYISSIAELQQLHPWEKRQNKAIWRGATSDLRFLNEDLPKYSDQEIYEIYKTRHRYRVCVLSLKYPELIDAGFTSTDAFPVLVPLIAPMRKPWVPNLSFHLQYKYLINLDGWGWSNNFWWGLAWGCLCMKPEHGMTDWFYSAFEPYVHYLPIKKDLSNLIELIQWAQSHDAEAKKIAENGAKLFRTEVTNDHGLLYFYLVLKEYENLQKFDTVELLQNTLSNPYWVKVVMPQNYTGKD